MKIKFILTAILIMNLVIARAQDSLQKQIDVLKEEVKSLKSDENSHFMVRGFAQFGMDATSSAMNFNMTSFNPVLLWRQGSNFLFESELEMEYMNNEFSLDIGYANATYLVTKGLSVKVGKILIPFGTFSERLHPSWVNKLSTAPLGMGHMDGMSPMADIGIDIRGGLQIGLSKLNYSFYVVNGPRLDDGIASPTDAGKLTFENNNDNNNNKAIGSRIGFLPFTNSSLEIGVSAYYAKPGSETSPFAGDTMNQNLNYKNVTAMLTAFDLTYVKQLSPISGVIDIRGQYNLSNVSNATYYSSIDSMQYTFTNKSSAYYVQFSYRPSMVDNDILRNFELVTRYSAYTTPKYSLWYSDQTQMEIGLNYWIGWRSVIKFSYQYTDGTIAGTGTSGMAGMPGMSNGRLAHATTPTTTTTSTSSSEMGTSNGYMFLLHLAIGL